MSVGTGLSAILHQTGKAHLSCVWTAGSSTERRPSGNSNFLIGGAATQRKTPRWPPKSQFPHLPGDRGLTRGSCEPVQDARSSYGRTAEPNARGWFCHAYLPTRPRLYVVTCPADDCRSRGCSVELTGALAGPRRQGWTCLYTARASYVRRPWQTPRQKAKWWSVFFPGQTAACRLSLGLTGRRPWG